MTSSRVAGFLVALVLVSSIGAGFAVQPAAAGPLSENESVLDRSVTANQGWLGSWSPDENVVRHGAEGYPGWVVTVEKGHVDDLESWANQSTSRTVRSVDNDSSMVVVTAPADAVLDGGTFSSSLKSLDYVERIGVKRHVSVDPIRPSELRDQDAWSKPEGSFMATWGGFSGTFSPDGSAWGPEVNTSALAEIRQRVGVDEVAVNGSGSRVAVVDTGFKYDRSTFEDRVPLAYNAITNTTVNISDPANATASDYEAVSTTTDHGPWISTVIAGNGSTPNSTGIAPGATLLPVKALGEDGTGSTTDIARGIEWAAEQGNADVISLSLGSPLPNAEITAEIKEALRDDGVSAVTVAAGNNRLTYRYVASPADAEVSGLVTVAATDAKPLNESESAYFSAVAPDPHTGESLDLAAPGMSITAYVPGSGNVTLSGTSMATPVVSGVAALTLDDDPSLRGSPAELASRLETTAKPMPQAGSTEVGAGRVTATGAVRNTIPEQEQSDARSSTATARDRANRGLSGSMWRGGILLLSPPTSEVLVEVAG